MPIRKVNRSLSPFEGHKKGGAAEACARVATFEFLSALALVASMLRLWFARFGRF